jgi:hypothetical protein
MNLASDQAVAIQKLADFSRLQPYTKKVIEINFPSGQRLCGSSDLLWF